MQEQKLHLGTPFLNDVIVVDGMWGSGKSLLSSIVGSLERVEKKRIDHIFEYLLIGVSLGHVTAEFTRKMIRLYADLDQYNNLIGREVNLRVNDDSGFRNTPRSFRYVLRLFGAEGDQVVDHINQENLALLLLTHHVTGISGPLYESLKSRLFLIEVIRHPLQLVNYWRTYFGSFERSREFTLCIDSESSRIPWFAASWCDEFNEMSSLDKAIRSICRMHEISLMESNKVSQSDHPVNKEKRLVMPFEFMVTNTSKAIDQLADFLGRNPTSATMRAMRRQDLPRTLSSRGKAINSMNWLPNPKLSYRDQLDVVMQMISRDASKESVQLIKECTHQYETRLNDLGMALPT
jgi:hypothetical protein